MSTILQAFHFFFYILVCVRKTFFSGGGGGWTGCSNFRGRCEMASPPYCQSGIQLFKCTRAAASPSREESSSIAAPLPGLQHALTRSVQPAMQREPPTATKRAPTLFSFSPSDSSLQFGSCRLDNNDLGSSAGLEVGRLRLVILFFRLEPETSAVVSNGKKKVVISQKWRG